MTKREVQVALCTLNLFFKNYFDCLDLERETDVTNIKNGIVEGLWDLKLPIQEMALLKTQFADVKFEHTDLNMTMKQIKALFDLVYEVTCEEIGAIQCDSVFDNAIKSVLGTPENRRRDIRDFL